MSPNDISTPMREYRPHLMIAVEEFQVTLLATGQACKAMAQRQGPQASTAASLMKLGITEMLSAPGGRIAGGTSQVQRNIIGERLLGLPREPKPATS